MNAGERCSPTTTRLWQSWCPEASAGIFEEALANLSAYLGFDAEAQKAARCVALRLKLPAAISMRFICAISERWLAMIF